MNNDIKPIQPTPVLSGVDAQRIIAEAKTPLSDETIEKHKRMLKIAKEISKN